MIQKYGGSSPATVPLFHEDMRRMMFGRKNHPCIVQWTLFNEGDCWNSFNVSASLDLMRSYDQTRLIDVDSGGDANDFHLGDVNDIHTYPWPGDTNPTTTQYGMVGEFGGVGAFIPGKEWVAGKCTTYLKVDTPQAEADAYIKMAQMLKSVKKDISVSIYTQITDVELECDGFLNYDRSNKFTAEQTKAIFNANQDLIFNY